MAHKPLKIGIYSSHFSENRDSNNYAQKRLTESIINQGHEYKLLFPGKWTFFVSKRNVQVFYDNKYPEIDGMIIKGTSGARIPTSLLTNSLYFQKIPTVDKRQAFSGQYMTKFGALLRRYSQLREYIPHTFLIYSRESAYSLIKKGLLKPPLIRKPIQGTRGVGVIILNTIIELNDFIDQYSFRDPLLLQDYIRDAEEFRSIVVNNQCIGTVKKIPNNNGLGNFAQGAVFTKPEKKQDELIKYYSEKFSEKTPYDVLGIDILKDKDGNIFIIEANRNPQFKGFEMVHEDINVSEHIIQLLAERIKKIKSG